jgi:hypothetical protein
MGLHVEWEHAAECEVGTYTRREANDELELGETVAEPFVVVLGGGSGGCLAVEGDAAQLRAFAERVARAVRDMAGDAR